MRDHRPYNRRSSIEAIGLRGFELGRPLDLGPGDDRYVEAVMRAGGFAAVRRVHGAIYFAARERDGVVRTWMQP